MVCCETGLIVGARWTFNEAVNEVVKPLWAFYGHVFHFIILPNK